MLPPLLCLQTIITNLLFYSPPSHKMPRGTWIWNHFPHEHHHNDYLTLLGLFYFHLHLTCDQWHEIWVKLGPCPGEGNGNPLQYSYLENPLERGAWWAAVHGSYRVGHDWSDLACMHALEKEMATHSSILPWGIPGTEAPGGLQSIGLHRVGHDWSDLACMHAWSLSSEEPKCDDITRIHMGMVCLCLRRKDSAGDYGPAPFVLSLCLLRKILTRGRCKCHPQVGFQHLAPPHWSVLNDMNSLRL